MNTSNLPSGAQNKFFGQKVSKAGKNVYNASDADLIYKNDYSTTTYYDTTNSRVALGLLPDGTYGLQVSKPGYNVTDNNNNNLIFNSAQNVFKIVKTDTITIPSKTLPAGNLYSNIITIPHGLNFTPIIQSYAKLNTSFLSSSFVVQNILAYQQLPYNQNQSLMITNVLEYFIIGLVDETNIYFGYLYETDTTGGYSFPTTSIKYYLLQESVN